MSLHFQFKRGGAIYSAHMEKRFEWRDSSTSTERWIGFAIVDKSDNVHIFMKSEIFGDPLSISTKGLITQDDRVIGLIGSITISPFYDENEYKQNTTQCTATLDRLFMLTAHDQK